MLGIIEILIPIFLLILLGYLLKVLNFPHRDFWDYLDKFNYFILFPSLLIYKLSTANIKEIKDFDYVIATVLGIFAVSFLLVIINKILKFNNARFTSIYQGSVRFNTYVFFAFVDSLFGDMGLVLSAFMIAFIIPLLNVLSISVFSIYLSKTKIGIYSFLKSIFKNPLIVSCIIGGGLNYFDISLPSFVLSSLGLLSSAALPLGLLSVGVGLYFSSAFEYRYELIVSSFVKLILKPIVVYFIAISLGVSDVVLLIVVIFSAMPTATSSYILAKQLGGDEKLMSSIISIQIVLSIFTIWAIVSFIQ